MTDTPDWNTRIANMNSGQWIGDDCMVTTVAEAYRAREGARYFMHIAWWHDFPAGFTHMQIDGVTDDGRYAVTVIERLEGMETREHHYTLAADELVLYFP